MKNRRYHRYIKKVIPQLIGMSVLFFVVYFLFFSPLFPIKKTRAQTSSFTFGVAGDFGGSGTAGAVFDGIKSKGAAFTLGVGDFSYGDVSDTSWCSLVQQHMGSTYPFEIVSGNHDSWESTPNGNIDNFVQCLPDRLGAVGGNGGYGREYYFDYPATNPIARFIMISPNLTFTNGGFYDYSKGSTHYNWVASTIDNARTSGIKWIIVGMHKMCLDTGGYDYDCDIDGMTEDVFNLLLSKKVDLIVNGHEHYYGRTKQLSLTSSCPAITINGYNSGCVVNGASTGYTKGAGTVETTIGTGGYSQRALLTTSETPYFANEAGNLYGYGIFNLSSSQLSMNYYSTTGRFTDAFTITDSGAPTPTVGPTATPTPTPVPQTSFRVYPGGTTYTDTSGNTWSPDGNYASAGSLDSTTTTIAGTNDQPLYQSERWGAFTYNFPLKNGTYNVTLKFAEIYFTSVGQRIFNVAINGSPVLTNFDIVQAAGAANTAIDKTFQASVTNGNLAVTFTTGSADDPKISSLQIVPSGSTNPTPTSSPTPTPQSSTPTPTPKLTTTPTPGCTLTPTSPNKVTTTAHLAAGTYTVWSRIQTPVSGGSYYLQIGSNCPVQVMDNTVNSWDWIANPTTLTIPTTQDATVTLTQNTSGVGVDRLIFSDSSCIPSGTGDNCLSVLPTPTPTLPVVSPTPTPVVGSGTTIRVYAGSTNYTDHSGNVWSSDGNYASAGSLTTTTNAIAGTTDQALYQSERWGAFTYTFPVTNGNYAVTLKFAEFYFTSIGQRIFNVAINGSPVLTNFDIVQAAGSANTAIDKTFQTTVTNGTLTITFTTGSADDPKIDAVQILPITTLSGDLNGDGVVNGADVIVLLQNWLKNLTGIIDQFGDGRINSMDFVQLIKKF